MRNGKSIAIDAAEMAGLVRDAEERTWREALSAAYEVSRPQILLEASAAYLTGWMHLLPRLGANARVLSLDANFGATTEGLARRYTSVTHFSLCSEHAPFCAVRFEQEGLDVDSVGANAGEPLFGDCAFDLVVAPLLLKVAPQAEALRRVARALTVGGTAVVGWTSEGKRRLLGPRGRDRAFAAAGLATVAAYPVHPGIETPLTVMNPSPRGGMVHLVKARSRSHHSTLRVLRDRATIAAARLGWVSSLFSDYLVVARKV